MSNLKQAVLKILDLPNQSRRAFSGLLKFVLVGRDARGHPSADHKHLNILDSERPKVGGCEGAGNNPTAKGDQKYEGTSTRY